MKLLALHLLAFGPFTDKVVRFDEGPANLHLIYGPNEAGKSSALRAMGDLRFGIGLRSTDNFLHASDKMLVGGSFVDAAGQAVDLLRNKKRGTSLLYFDVDTGQADMARVVSRDHETALTGGLARADFAAMFAIDHARLREGGQQLLRGDGELGAALFEASAGTRGIAAVVGQLEEDAKALFNPRGNARNAVLNEAGKQFDEARKAHRDALVKPAEWQQRKRAHDEASEALALVADALVAERRQLNELTELRTVEPLLRQLDVSVAELARCADAPLLPESARDERLAAEPALARAEDDLAQASAQAARCRSALQAIVVDEAFMAHAAAIERFSSSAEATSRSRVEVHKLQASIDRLASDAQAFARRIAGKGASPADVLVAVPSAAEHRALSLHVKALEDLHVELRMLRQQAAGLVEQLAEAAESRAAELPDAGLRASVADALHRAQALGDVEQRLRDTDRQRRELSMQVAQSIGDLETTLVLMESLRTAPGSSSSSPAADVGAMDFAAKLRMYRDARPLLGAEIEAVRVTGNLRDELHRKVTVDLEALRRDIDVQRQLQVELAAAGEVVTADVLGETRRQRDALWSALRAAYIDARAASSDDAPPPADAFESLSAQADRQADMLRADAERAARFEVSRARVTQMSERQGELLRQEERLSLEDNAAAATWTQTLRDAGLPVALTPSGLLEWQALRATLLDRADRLAGLQADRESMLAAVSRAIQDLGLALQGFGQEPSRSGPADDGAVQVGREVEQLTASMQRAADFEAAAARQVTAYEARTAALAAQRLALAKARASIAQAEAAVAEHRAALQPWLERAFLPVDSTPDMCRARLAELLELQTLASDLSSLQQRQGEQAAIGREILLQAAHVATLLDDDPPAEAGVQDYADDALRRLRLNQEAERQRLQWQRDLDRALAAMADAGRARDAQGAVLARLCRQAGVADPTLLVEAEERSMQRRRAEADVARQQALLARASARAQADLQARLQDDDTVSLDARIDACRQSIDALDVRLATARQAEQAARAQLEAIDASDAAAGWREQMEQAGARYRAAVVPWARLRLAHALLQESLRLFRERAQAPMVQAASRYFSLMTGGFYTRLVAVEEGDKPVLQAERAGGQRIAVDAMSEGTGDQLYLALRLAALELRGEAQAPMPLILDDVLMTSDDVRAGHMLNALAAFAEKTQVLVFTHHRHIQEVGRARLGPERLAIHEL